MLTMRIGEDYAEELHTINAAYRGGRQGFRTTEVCCADVFGRKISFSKHHDVPLEMARLMDVFAAEFDSTDDIPAIALCFARFFYAFIAIHPFRDASRRTAFAFMENRSREKSCDIHSINVLRRVLLEGDVAAEMQKLRSLFITMLKPQL